MNTNEQGILCLIKSAVTGTSVELPNGFDLDQAYPVLKKHCIVPLGFLGAMQCGISKNMPVMRQMMLQYRAAVIHSSRQMHSVQALCDAFEKNGIDYMPVKGCNMKALYPAPELRPMGDADILIRLEQYPQIRPIMLSLGYQESCESDHELIWISRNLMAELHKRLIPSYNKDYYAYYGDGWCLGKLREGHRFYMEPEDEYVYLFTHFAKHYRDGGIGLRHILDLWVYRREYPQLDMNYIEGVLQKMQLNEFFHNIQNVLSVWFCSATGDEKTELISEFIFSNGSWGTFSNQQLSAMVKYRQSVHSASSGFRVILGRLFPRGYVMTNRYPILKTRPYLLPFFWIRRIFKRAISRKGHLPLLSTLTSDKLEQYENALTYVGLGFHFEE